jgi:hypothetical protein
MNAPDAPCRDPASDAQTTASFISASKTADEQLDKVYVRIREVLSATSKVTCRQRIAKLCFESALRDCIRTSLTQRNQSVRTFRDARMDNCPPLFGWFPYFGMLNPAVVFKACE